MLERLTFKNHLNQMLEFGDGEGIFLNMNDLHSYKWNYTSKNNKISFFSRDIQEKKIPIVVYAKSRNDGYAVMNTLMEMADKDIIANIAGKIIIGDYYLECFVFESEKAKYDLEKGLFYATLTVVTDKPTWVKEITRSFEDASGGAGTGFDYPYDFPYDFTSPNSIRELNNTGFADSDFKLIIYGEITDPAIYIAGHKYALTGHIGSGEYAVIDSRDKSVVLMSGGGTQTNWFSHRDRNDYIFQKIPSGVSNVAWAGGYGFDVVLFDERSEPLWYSYGGGGDEPRTIEPFTDAQMQSLLALFAS